MKFEWKYRYVPEGQLEPDKHGRWAIDCFVFVDIAALPEKYAWLKGTFERDYVPVRVAIMEQKGSGDVPSTIHRFACCIPSFEHAGTGMSNQHYFYSNDIEELKKIVEDQFLLMQNVFVNCQ